MPAPIKNPTAKADDASLDAIPMKRSSPLMIFAIVGAVVLVGVVVAWSSMKKKADKVAPANAATASAEADPFAGMSAEERKRHIEITRKSLQQVAEQQAADEAKKKAEEDAKKETEAQKAPSGGGVAPAPAAPVGETAPVAAKSPAADEPPKKKQPTAGEKKKMDDLDKLGSDISGKLGK